MRLSQWPGGAGDDGVGFDSPCPTVRHRDGSERLRFPWHYADRARPCAAGQHRLGCRERALPWRLGQQHRLRQLRSTRTSKSICTPASAAAKTSPGTSVSSTTAIRVKAMPDFPELYASVGYSFLTGKIWYSNEFGGFDNDVGVLLRPPSRMGAAVANFGLNAHIGYSDGDGDRRFLRRQLHGLVGRRDLHARQFRAGSEVRRRQRSRGRSTARPATSAAAKRGRSSPCRRRSPGASEVIE